MQMTITRSEERGSREGETHAQIENLSGEPLEKREMRKDQRETFALSLNLPARFDWSIIGWTILRRALMSLEGEGEEKENSCKDSIAHLSSSNPSNRRLDLSTLCLQHRWNKKKKMINDSKHHLIASERKKRNCLNDRSLCVYVCILICTIFNI